MGAGQMSMALLRPAVVAAEAVRFSTAGGVMQDVSFLAPID